MQPNEDGSYWRKIVRNKMVTLTLTLTLNPNPNQAPVTAAAAEGRGLLRAIADAAVGTAAQQHDHNDFEVKAGMEMDGYIDRQTGR